MPDQSIAQPIIKGAKFLFASFSMSYETLNSDITGTDRIDRRSGLSLSPQYGVFLRDNLSLSMGLRYNYFETVSRFEDQPNSRRKNRSNLYSASVGLSKYWSVYDRLYLSVGYGINGGLGDEQQSDDMSPQEQVELNNWSIGCSVTPGLTYVASDRLVFSGSAFGFSYTYRNSEFFNIASNQKSNQTSHDLDLRLISNGFSLGLSYFFLPKAEKQELRTN